MEVVTIQNATLYLGDCNDVLKEMRSADFIFADPPYLEGDFSPLLFVLTDIAPRVVVTPGKLESFNWIRRASPTWEYAWQNAAKSLGGSHCLHIGWEPILCWGAPVKPLGTDILNYPISSDPNKPDHPWPKPIKLMEKIVAHWSKDGQTVVDPFLGSGTTGMACAQLGRPFIGIEKERRYFDVACERIEAAHAQQRLFA